MAEQPEKNAFPVAEMETEGGRGFGRDARELSAGSVALETPTRQSRAHQGGCWMYTFGV